jgi:DNA-binding beta-propeller fold protein YncE
MRRSARCLSLILAVLPAVLAAVSASAQDVRGYIYAAVPGVANDEKAGGIGILVFDADNGHKFVRRIPTWEAYRREAIEPIKGIAAHATTGRLYVSTTRRLAAFDLATDKIVWQKGYDADCCDRMAVSADGKTLYVPAFNLPKWYVVDAVTGNAITTIVTEGEAHNTIYSPHTGRVYLASLRTSTMAIADSRTNQVVKRVGPFSDQTRPFAINGKETLVYVNVNNLLGVAVGDLQNGKVLHEVSAPGFAKGKPRAHGTVSHGIALTYDEKEIWVADGPNSHVHIFDATSMPPKYKESVKLRAEPGWFTCSIDGKLIYPSSGEVIDIASRKVVATLEDEKGRHVETEKLLQIDFAGGRPVRAGDQFCFGQVR